MTERIVIENFGGIKFVDLELRSINVLIGPQASGKSIIAKLLYFFKNFTSEIFKSIDKEENKRQLDSRQKEKFQNYFPKDSWPKGPFKITYYINNSIISIERKGNIISFGYSSDIVKIINKCRHFYKEEQKKIQQEQKSPAFRLSRNTRLKFYDCISKEISNISSYNQFFVPAGRSFFANIQSGIFSFLSDNRQLDPFLIEFGSFYENFKRYYFDNEFERKKKKDGFDDLIAEIMSGTYLREKEKDFLIHKDARKVNLSYSSSGQQESLPLIVVLKTLTTLKMAGGGATLYIEEPEAHLFPTAQKRIVELLARTYNTIDSKFQIIVTTHSPYILSAFNNLMEAGKIVDEKAGLEDSVYKIVPKEEAFNPNELVAYSINQGQKAVLIDSSNKLISQNILDSVSDEISIEFGKLLDLEF